MGRTKLKKELISNAKNRRITFQGRVKSLKKKISELVILCDVKAYAVIYGPKQGGDTERLIKPETWPENKNDIRDFLKQYQDKHDVLNKQRTKQEEGIVDFFMTEKENLRSELVRLRGQKNATVKYPTWDERLDHYSLDQLKTLTFELDLKIEEVEQKIFDRTEGEFDMLEEAINCFSSSPVVADAQPLSYLMDDHCTGPTLPCAYGIHLQAMEFQQRVIDAWESHGPSAIDESSEAHRLLEQFKKMDSGLSSTNEVHTKALPLPRSGQLSIFRSSRPDVQVREK